MKKRMISLLLAVVMLLGVLPVSVLAAKSGTCGDNLTWSLDSGTLTISGTGDMWDYGYYASNRAPWYQVGYGSTQRVIIEDGVTSIGKYAFKGMDYVESAVISDTVVSIGISAFEDCESLSSVSLGDQVKEIGNSAFYICERLNEIVIPKSVERIGVNAFDGCVNLLSLKIENGVKYIGIQAFSSCTKLSEVNLPDSVTTIGGNLFWGCTSLKKITIGAGLSEIETYSAFGKCLALEYISVDESNLHFSSADGVLFNKEQTKLIQYPAGKTNLKYVIPDGVDIIEENAFWYAQYLTDISIPDSVSRINDLAFSQVQGLSSVILPDGISLGYGVFQGTNLSYVEIPATFSGSMAFLGCNQLKTAGPVGGGYNVEFNWTNKIPDLAFAPFEYLQEIVLPEGITEVGDYAFDGCNCLEKLVLPESLEVVSSTMYYLCSATLESAGPAGGDFNIEFAWKEQIPAYAFFNCNHLQNVTLPASVKEIGEKSFSYTDIEEIVIPKNTYSIGNEAFTQCSNLTGAFFCGDAPEIFGEKVFDLCADDFVIYYVMGTSGWTDSDAYDAEAGTWHGYKLATWDGVEDDGSLRIVSKYPENGEKGIVNTTNNPLVITMTFNYDVAAVADASEGKGYFEIYKLADETGDNFTPTLVYRLEDKAADVTISGRTVKIDVSSADFVNNAAYIITMGPNVISFTDTDETIGFYGTQWKFETGAFADGDYQGVYGSRFSFEDSYFAGGNSNIYNHNLAMVSCNLAIAAYNASDAPEKGYSEAASSRTVREMLLQLGFDEDSIDTSMYGGKPSQTSIAAAIATKELNIGSEDETWTLLAIAVRGGNYEAEWGGDFWVGETGNHIGFQDPANQVKNKLKAYLKTHPIEGNVAVWITGYSRGAATANLLSANLHTSSGCSYVGLKVDAQNIYTYTFETPMGVAEENYETYDNIFSLVNPIDLVTKVAPAKWDFTRYGVDCMFPSTGTTSHYSEYLERVGQYYTAFSGKSLPDEFTAYKLNVELDYGFIPHIYMTNDISSSRKYQSYFLDEFLNDSFCTDFFASRAQYCDELENVLMDVMASICGKTIDKAALTDQILNELAEAMLEWAIKRGLIKVVDETVEICIELIDDVTDISKNSLADRIARILIEGNVIDMPEDELAEDIHALLNVDRFLSFAILHFEELYTLIVNYRWLAVAHEPQFCLAWLNTVTDGYMSNANGRKYRVLTVNCPVDVQVYDSSDILVAAIIDDQAQDVHDSTIETCIDRNGQKIVILPTDETYRVEITATGEGTMTYSVSEYDLSLGETTRIVNYYDVELTGGEKFTGTVEMLEGETPAVYPLLEENGEQISVSEDLRGESVKRYTVRTQTVGSGAVNGGGVFNRGEYVKLTAFPEDGSVFWGWYSGNALVSSESEYRFCVKQDWEITAKFSTTEQTTEDEEIKPAVPTAPEKSEEAETADVDYSDTGKNDWFYESVQYVTVHGLMNGVGGGKFAPNATLTRAMLVQVLYNLEGKPAVGNSSGFADVAFGAWYADAVAWAEEHGIVTGYSADRFGPEDAVTREQTAAIFQRYAAYKGFDTGACGGLTQFSDAASVSTYARDAVAWAVDTGLLSGKGGGRLDPAGTATRAEIAAILMRFCENVLK